MIVSNSSLHAESITLPLSMFWFRGSLVGCCHDPTDRTSTCVTRRLLPKPSALNGRRGDDGRTPIRRTEIQHRQFSWRGLRQSRFSLNNRVPLFAGQFGGVGDCSTPDSVARNPCKTGITFDISCCPLPVCPDVTKLRIRRAALRQRLLQ